VPRARANAPRPRRTRQRNQRHTRPTLTTHPAPPTRHRKPPAPGPAAARIRRPSGDTPCSQKETRHRHDGQPTHSHLLSSRPQAPGDVGRAVLAGLGAAGAATIGWGLLSGVTTRHYLLALPLVATVLALALTSTPARRAWLPVLAGVLSFAVGYLGDVLAVAWIPWRHGYNAGLIADHLPTLIGAVNDGHSATDWIFFTASGLAAAATTAARQKARPTTPTTPTPH
jgi:hypothetical protein